MKEYQVTYRRKRNKQGLLYHAHIFADDIWKARELAQRDLADTHTIVSIKIVR